MDITICSHKGGVAKTTSAVHIAAFLQQKAPTLLVDADPNRSATAWSERGERAFPFKVADEREAIKFARDVKHVVVDTEARAAEEDMKALSNGCDLLILPTTADALALDVLMQTIEALKGIGAANYKVLLTAVPPRPNHDADDVRAMLTAGEIKVFKGQIRRLVAFQKAALQGLPVYAVSDPRAGEAWSDYEAIGKEILKG